MKRLKVAEMSGIILTEFLQPPSLKSPKHFHDSATVFITLKGYAADGMMGRVYECNPSNVLIRPAGETHTHQYGRTGVHGLVVEVKSRKLEAVRAFSPVLDRIGSFNELFLSELAMRLYTESLMMDSASELAIEGIFLEMLARVTRKDQENKKQGVQPRWLNHVVEFIHENYAQTTGLSELAELVGINPAHLAEVFRKHTGCSVGEYIRRLRTNSAVREVLLTEKSLADISLRAGFYDQSHFTKFFKRYTGLTPAEMRAISKIPRSHTKSRQSSKIS